MVYEEKSKSMDRHIVHYDQDTFFVSVARLENSALLNRPVLIGGGSDRGVVASCSYEARAFGVHAGMPMRMARLLCPQAAVVRGDMDTYSRYSQIITQIIAEKAPTFEKPSIDEHYVDLTGMDKYIGCQRWAHEMREWIIRETGLPISFGLSSNKTVSKVATGQAKPNGELKVDRGTEKPFLAPLSIRKIPMIGAKAYHTLRNMGVERVGTLQELQPELMERVMGKNGVTIWHKANGIDDSPVVPYSERKSIGTEDTFDKDTTDMEFLRKTIVTMVDKIAFELRKKGKVASQVVVKIRYSNFDTHEKQATIPYTSADHVLTRTALELFKKLYSRRMLIRLVGVKLTGLVSGSHQINLFDDTASQVSLYQALDKIRLRFGAQSVVKAISL